MLLSDMPAKNTAWFGQNLTSHTQLARWANCFTRQQTLCDQSHSMSKCNKADSNGSGTQPTHTTHTTLTNGCSLAGQTRAQVRPARLPKITIRSFLPAEWRAISLLHNLGLGSSPSAQSPPTWLAPLVNNKLTQRLIPNFYSVHSHSKQIGRSLIRMPGPSCRIP